MEQQYAVPSELGTTYIITDNPPVGATLVQGDQSPSSNTKPSLEQRIEVLEKAVSNINERLGIKTDSGSVDLEDASKLLDSLDSSAANKATNELANSNSMVSNVESATTTPTNPSGSATAPIPMDPASLASAIASSAPIPTDPSSSASASSASAPIPSADDIAKQLGDLT
jgi:hypothetical protein